MSILKIQLFIDIWFFTRYFNLYINNKVSKEYRKTDYMKLFFLVFIILFLTLQIFIFNVENGGSGLSFDSGNVNVK